VNDPADDRLQILCVTPDGDSWPVFGPTASRVDIRRTLRRMARSGEIQGYEL